MASERRKTTCRKLSCGILKTRTHGAVVDHRENRGVKIYIRNQHDGALPPDIDEEQFERLKDMYYKQCQPINMNLIRKLAEKRTASNYNYYNSAQCSRVFPRNIGSTSNSAAGMTNSSHARDVAVKPREYKSSDNEGARKSNRDGKDYSCSRCQRHHY